MLKGINQWTFPAGTPLREVFSLSSKAGYDCVELTVLGEGAEGLTIDATRSRAAVIKNMADDCGIQLQTLCSGMFLPFQLSSENPSDRDKAREMIVRQLEIASWLGVDTFLVVPGAVDKNTPYDVCYSRTQEQMFKLADEAKNWNVRLGVENVWNRFLLSPLEMARYIDEINSPYVGVYLDVGNMLLFGFPEHWIRILNKRIFKVHVKDFRTQVNTAYGFVPLLSGDVDWAEVRKALREIGYAGPLTAEVGGYSFSPEQAVFDTARHLDVIIGKSPH